MAYIIPNATDTTSSNRYAVLDQAEPDSIDFEVLGNDKSGVISGCEVDTTAAGGNTAVSVASGVVAINGTIYNVSPNPFLSVPSNPPSGNARFDLVVARLDGSGVTLTVLLGTPSSTNPTYPRSASRLVSTAGQPQTSYYDPERDVVLAAIYRGGSIGTILKSHIVDKRKTVATSLTFKGSTEPSTTQGVVGDLYLRTSTVTNGESGLYVKRTESQWSQLASSPIDPGVPVGSVITWVAPVNPNTSVWVECNGTAVNRTGPYSSLFSLLGTLYGPGDGSTSFNLPDFRGMILSGLPAAGSTVGAVAGNTNNQIELTSSQIPGHTHPINHGHASATTTQNGFHGHGSEGGSHVHAMDHGHGTTTVSGGDHAHSANYLQNANNTGPNHYLRPVNYPTDGLIAAIPQSGGHSHIVTIPNFSGFTAPSSSGTSSVNAGAHTHTVAIPMTTGEVSGTNRSNAPAPVNIQPRTVHVRYFIRYA